MPPPLVSSAGYDAQLVLSSPNQSATYYVRYAQGNLPFAAGTIPAGGRVIVTAGPDHIAPFDVVGAQGLFVVSTASDLVVEQLTVGTDWQIGATIPGQWAALGTRFRVAGFSLDASPEAYDALSLYAPTGASVVVQAKGTTFFGNADVGATSVTLPPRTSIVLHATDLDGALVTATQPITVMAGGRGYPSSSSPGCDGNDAGEIVIPTRLWGRSFVVGSFAATSAKDIRIVADSDATHVSIDGGATTSLAAGQVLTIAETAAVQYVVADKPIAVFHNSGSVGCQVELAYVPPIVLADVSTSTVTFAMLGSGTVAVVGRSVQRPSLTFNGVTVGTADKSVPGRTDLFYTAVDVSDGTFVVSMIGDFQLAMVSSGNGLGGRFTYFNPVRAEGCGDGVLSAGEGCDDHNLIPNDTCSPVCTVEPPIGKCVADTDCVTATHFCNGITLFCEPRRSNGGAIPDDGLHDGTCSVANAASICASGQCNARAATCAGTLYTACSASVDCIVDHCGANGQCGFADGEGPCDSASAMIRCQSGACSTAGACIPVGGCFVDRECPAAEFCERTTFACAPDRAPGDLLPDDGLHDGACTAANANAVCASGICNAITDTCAVPDGSACSDDAQCDHNLCGSALRCVDPAACSGSQCNDIAGDPPAAAETPGGSSGGCSATDPSDVGLMPLIALAWLSRRRSRRAQGFGMALSSVQVPSNT